MILPDQNPHTPHEGDPRMPIFNLADKAGATIRDFGDKAPQYEGISYRLHKDGIDPRDLPEFAIEYLVSTDPFESAASTYSLTLQYSGVPIHMSFFSRNSAQEDRKTGNLRVVTYKLDRHVFISKGVYSWDSDRPDEYIPVRALTPFTLMDIEDALKTVDKLDQLIDKTWPSR